MIKTGLDKDCATYDHPNTIEIHREKLEPKKNNQSKFRPDLLNSVKNQSRRKN